MAEKVTTKDLDAIFSPRSIAVVGASTRPGIGNQVLRNLIEGGYEGAIYPIHPKGGEILGRRAFPSLADVPGEIDMAVFCVPEKACREVAEQCARKGVKGYVVISSNFSEVGNKAAELELVRIARESGGRLVGPNVVGLLLNQCKANASFAPCLPYPGRTALISQSGALLIALDTATFARRLGVSSMISLGNMADIDFADCIDYYAKDPDTGCIALYIEGLKDGRRFIESGRKADKPIVALKAGVSAHGAAAAASHTGSIAGSMKIYDAAFKQAHIVWADDLGDWLDTSQALAMQPPMRGDNVLILTNGGGVGVLATDTAERVHIPIEPAPKDLQDAFRTCMPEFGSAKNPVDLTGGAGVKGYEQALLVALKSDWCHGVAVLYCETAMTVPVEIAEGILRAVNASGVSGKPVVATFIGGDRCHEAVLRLEAAGIPVFEEPSRAIRALAALRQVHAFNQEGCSLDFWPYAGVEQQSAREVIVAARKDGRSVLTEPEAKEIFKAYGLPVTRGRVAKTPDEAVQIAREIGFPVVLKIVSPHIIHKSEAGGVKVNIKDDPGVREAYGAILANAKRYKPDADIHGILVIEMAQLGKEVIVGSVNDPAFGPTVMFGLGGIFVEVLKDVTFRVAPFSPTCAMQMFPEIKAYPILKGVRGEKRLDLERLATVVSRLSQLVTELSDEIAETDANPIMLYEEGKGLTIVDARIILKKT